MPVRFSLAIEEERDRSDSSSIAFCFLRTFQWRHSAKDANQSEIWSCAQMEGTGYMDVVTCRLWIKVVKKLEGVSVKSMFYFFHFPYEINY